MDQATSLRNIIKKNSKAPNSLSADAIVSRVITVTSGKGGVGKSNTAINLAIELKKLGKSVLIFDADFGLANIEIMFGAIPQHNLADVIYEGKNIKDVITPGPMDIGFISGGSGIAQLSDLSTEQIGYLVRNLTELDSLADVIIIDTGAGISGAVLEFLVASSEVLLITTPEPTSITDSYSLLKALSRHPGFDPSLTRVRMIANRVEDYNEGLQLYQKLHAVVKRYLSMSLEFLGSVPQDNALLKAVMQQSPVCIADVKSKAARAYASLAAVLMEMEPERKTSRNGMSGFFNSLLAKLGR